MTHTMDRLAVDGSDMPAAFRTLVDRWDGEEVIIRHDAASNAWIFIAIHKTIEASSPWGMSPRSAGGTRMRVYPDPVEGLTDALKLSAAMTRKFKVAGLGIGGAKAVLAVDRIPQGEERLALLRHFAALVDSLDGRYLAGPDMNTSVVDMDTIRELTPFVLSRSVERGGSGDSGIPTARGVFHAIRASLGQVFGSDSLVGRTVLVQGAGGVGRQLVRMLVEAGATVMVADIDRAVVARLMEEVEVIPVDAILATQTRCDVFSPCAVGGILNAESITRLRCTIVAGSANNQLALAEDGELLRQRGILYAPDYVANAGGAIAIAGREMLGWDTATVEEHLAGIGLTLRRIYRRAEADGVSPAVVADQLSAESRVSPLHAARIVHSEITGTEPGEPGVSEASREAAS
jgi:leucine dehydrogenase